MSWIRNHIRHYVAPGIFAIAAELRKVQRNPKYWRMLSVNIEDKPFPARTLRPAKGFPNPELGLIWTALCSVGYAPHVGVLLEHSLRNMKVTGILPNRGQIYGPDGIHNIVKNSTKSLRRILHKDGRRKLILPGRDVWLWSVACHKRKIPHIFDARISRTVARNEAVLGKIVKDWRVNHHTFIFDTGFTGSIYECIKKVSKKEPQNLMLSTGRPGQQIYPNHKGSRGKALAIEYLPKYQKTGTIRREQAVQWLSGLDEFIKAALLTIWFWHHESPAWIDQGGTRCTVVDCNCRSCKLWKEKNEVQQLSMM